MNNITLSFFYKQTIKNTKGLPKMGALYLLYSIQDYIFPTSFKAASN